MAIALCGYTRDVEPAFNCRLHSIMLHEMLLSLGIANRFVTCQPFEDTGTDCHVVNVVWLPELRKWAMIDSDMHAWATVPGIGGTDDGIPLSLQEMRAMYVAGQPVEFHDLLREQRDFAYYKAYWARTSIGLSAGRTLVTIARRSQNLENGVSRAIPTVDVWWYLCHRLSLTNSYNRNVLPSSPMMPGFGCPRTIGAVKVSRLR